MQNITAKNAAQEWMVKTMTLERAIDLVTLERDYLSKKNDPGSRKVRSEIVQALDIALYALKAVQNIEQLFKYKGGADNG